MAKKGFSLEIEQEVPAAPVTEVKTDKTSRFILSSAILHGALMGGLMIASLPMFQPPKTETITIELADNSPAPKSILQPKAEESAPQVEAKAEEPKQQPQEEAQPAEAPQAQALAVAAPAEEALAEPAPELQEEVAAPAAKPVVVAQAPKIKAAPKASVKAASAPTPTVAESPVEIPQNLDGEEAAQIDDSQFETKVAKIEDGDIDSSLAQVEGKMTPGVDAAEIQKDADQSEQEDLAKADQSEKESQAKAKIIAAQADALKKKNAQALASAKAAEAALAAAQAAADAKAARIAAAQKAAQERAGQEKAARDAAIAAGNAARAAAAAQAAQARQASNGNGNGKGSGNASSAGVPNGQIRKLENLKQMPGNPHPAYADSERLTQQEGDAVFLAYINKQGVPSNFKQVKSTGHTNLDSKTLSALKQWRFVPGQEGWVEIPFRWDLKGGPQERSALARRNAGISPDRGSLRTQ